MTSCVTYTVQLPYFSEKGLGAGLGEGRLCQPWLSLTKCDFNWISGFLPFLPRSSWCCRLSPSCFLFIHPSVPPPPPLFFAMSSCSSVSSISIPAAPGYLHSMDRSWWPPNLCQCGSMVSRCPSPDSAPNMLGTCLTYLSLSVHCPLHGKLKHDKLDEAVLLLHFSRRL